ncbi:MAG: hypothetical protein R2821_02395 [Flavobacteriaceae bacterium]|nr:hypothetical protein [Flavobacteriaceae bacterium]MCB0485746.1 hypothetical protein [Flavobacteriaceae bacterium]
MSFGGAVSAMLTSLKNNKRSRVSAFEKIKGYENIPYKKGKIEKKATPLQLKEIREKLQKENKMNTVIVTIVSIIVAVILVVLFYYVKF